MLILKARVLLFFFKNHAFFSVQRFGKALSQKQNLQFVQGFFDYLVITVVLLWI